MAFKNRRDGIYIRDLDPFKRLFPYVMEGRNNSVVYTLQRVDASNLLRFVDSLNAGRPDSERIGLFHVFLAVIARTFFLRPELNRFIVGRRFYQHKDISITFVAKKEYTEEAPEAEVRMTFTGKETLEEVRDMVNRRLNVARSDHRGDDDKLMDLVAALPRPIVSLIVGLVKRLDYHNILPAFLMDAIPLYTSIYLANLGSIGLGAPFHHLFEMGSASSFLTIGKIEKQPVVDEAGAVVARDCIEFAFAFDERVSEGFNHIRSIQVFQNLLTHPELLVNGETSIEAILAAGGGLKIPAPLSARATGSGA